MLKLMPVNILLKKIADNILVTCLYGLEKKTKKN